VAGAFLAKEFTVAIPDHYSRAEHTAFGVLVSFGRSLPRGCVVELLAGKIPGVIGGTGMKTDCPTCGALVDLEDLADMEGGLGGDYKEFLARCLEMTGHTSDWREAFDQWANEREALSEFHEDNQTYGLVLRRLVTMMQMSTKLVAVLEKESGLFMSDNMHQQVTLWRDFHDKFIEYVSHNHRIASNQEIKGLVQFT
jgi:hypothetical protein